MLIPEVALKLDGERGFLRLLEHAPPRRAGYAVIVVAEGPGRISCAASPPVGGATSTTDRQRERAPQGTSGLVLRERIVQHFAGRGVEITLKYIDPSYQIRSVPASPSDSVYCWNMARNAVHAATMANGSTEMLVGRWHGRFVHVPFPLATRFRKEVDVNDDLWMSVIESTGQPAAFG